MFSGSNTSDTILFTFKARVWNQAAVFKHSLILKPRWGPKLCTRICSGENVHIFRGLACGQYKMFLHTWFHLCGWNLVRVCNFPRSVQRSFETNPTGSLPFVNSRYYTYWLTRNVETLVWKVFSSLFYSLPQSYDRKHKPAYLTWSLRILI